MLLRRSKKILKKIMCILLNTVWNIQSFIYLCVLKVFKKHPKPQSDGLKDCGKTIYLTFDDGPSSYTRRLLRILKKYNVKVTFFVTGKGDADIITDIVRDGHAVGNHTESHNYQLIYASETAFLENLQKMDEMIVGKTGVHTKIMRFPGGSSNTVSRFNPKIMTRLTDLVQEMGYCYFDWSVDSDDAGRTRTSYKVFKNVIKGVKEADDIIVLQHDTKIYSIMAVERIIVWGLKNGYIFLSLDENSPSVHHKINN